MGALIIRHEPDCGYSNKQQAAKDACSSLQQSIVSEETMAAFMVPKIKTFVSPAFFNGAQCRCVPKMYVRKAPNLSRRVYSIWAAAERVELHDCDDDAS
jgi:hypothetical protein